MPKKSLTFEQQVENYMNMCRERHDKNRQYHSDLLDALKGAWAQFDGGINSIQIGNQTISLSDKENYEFSSNPQLEDHYTQLLNQGKKLYVINVNNDGRYYIPKPLFEEQSIDTLIDVDLIKQLAPSSLILTPQENRPWADIINSSSFYIFVTEKNEIEILWNTIRQWLKTDWHDQNFETPLFSNDVFNVQIHYDFSPDISWRFAQLKRAEKNIESLREIGSWDTLAQQELKKTLNSLIALENHPILENKIAFLLEEIKPLLVKSMSGKQVLNNANYDLNSKSAIFYQSVKEKNIELKNWEPDINKFLE